MRPFVMMVLAVLMGSSSIYADYPIKKTLQCTGKSCLAAVATAQVATANVVHATGDAYQRALASAQYRAANRVHGHVTHLEIGGTIRTSGVGWSSHNANPATCLGVPGLASATCVVVRGVDGWYATCVR